MSTTLLGALGTAALLGVTHAIEPDHVAGISSLTSRYGDARLSAVVGACFSAGHVALVVVWLAVGYLVLGLTEYPAVFETVGTLGVAAVLGLLGAVMAVGGFRNVAHAHEHRHGDERHAHLHLHLPLVDGGGVHVHDDQSHDDQCHHAHAHGLAGYLRTGLVGALFTLSPPLSMILFSSALFPSYGFPAVALAVVVYAVAITATMGLIGAGVGHLFGAAAGDRRAYGALRGVGGVVVLGFALSMAVGVLPGLG